MCGTNLWPPFYVANNVVVSYSQRKRENRERKRERERCNISPRTEHAQQVKGGVREERNSLFAVPSLSLSLLRWMWIIFCSLIFSPNLSWHFLFPLFVLCHPLIPLRFNFIRFRRIPPPFSLNLMNEQWNEFLQRHTHTHTHLRLCCK